MKRLERNLESTIPFVNSDFNDILQEQHRIAYSAYLDGINDMKYSTFSTNRGIILSGIEIDATPSTRTPISTSIRNGYFNWNITINKSKSVIYFDGQYYTPADDLIDPNEESSTIPFPESNALFIYPFTQSIEPPEDTIETYRSSIRGFRNGTTQSMTIDYRFQIVGRSIIDQSGLGWNSNSVTYDNVLPSNVGNIYPGATQGNPYILLSWGGTSRNLSRLLKLNSAIKDEVLITHTLKKWSTPTNITTIRGGFVYRDFGWTTTFPIGVPTFETFYVTGRNELKGFAGLTAMNGRFPVGYDSTSPLSPQSAGSLQFNYGAPGNIGGTPSLTFSNAQLPSHDHGGFVKPTEQNLDHSHIFYSDKTVQEIVGPPEQVLSIAFGEFDPDESTTDVEKFMLTRSKPYFHDQIFEWGLAESQVDFTNHKHEISSLGFDTPHENRPSYLVALYYYKL